jgi:hypothetical protein
MSFSRRKSDGSDSAPATGVAERLRQDLINAALQSFGETKPAAEAENNSIKANSPETASVTIEKPVVSRPHEHKQVYVSFTVELPVIDIVYQALCVTCSEEFVIVVQDNKVQEFAPRPGKSFMIRLPGQAISKSVIAAGPVCRFNLNGCSCQLVLLLFESSNDAQNRKD